MELFHTHACGDSKKKEQSNNKPINHLQYKLTMSKKIHDDDRLLTIRNIIVMTDSIRCNMINRKTSIASSNRGSTLNRNRNIIEIREIKNMEWKSTYVQ